MKNQNPYSAVQKITTILVSLFLVGTFSFSAYAVQVSQVETLLISDIDDTVKVSHVLNTFDTFKNAMRTDNSFLGMTSLFQMLESSQENLVFAYVSNAPESLMLAKHQALLKNAQFPAGELLLRQSLSDDEHKNRAIRDLVAKYNPKKLILIGDNAEQDTLIYARAAEEFKGLDVTVYIHQLYSSVAQSEAGKKLEKNQIGYVTAVDLALKWFANSWVSAQSLKAWVSQIVPRINQEALDISGGVVAFPKWMNCQEYRPVRTEEISDMLIAQYIKKRDRRCQTR